MLRRTFRSITMWRDVPQGPPDPILGVAEAFKRSTSAKKVNLGVGAYRDDNNKTWVLTSVQKAKDQLYNAQLDHEYLPIEGLESFRTAAAKLAYGDSSVITDKKVVSVQALSGTGSLRLGMEFLKRWYPRSSTVLIANPTWGNHKNIIKDAGLEWKEYTYYNPSTLGLNFEAMCDNVNNAPNGSVLLLHACAHNPTGVDLTNQQWDQFLEIVQRKEHLSFFDSAYQGFASGDIDRDGYAPRRFANAGLPMLLAQSFAKNFGLYGERVGCFSVVTDNQDEAARVMSQIKIIARPIYSNPPLFGARIVSTILNSPDLYQQWRVDVKIMADRIINMRHQLVKGLKDQGSTRDWKHITDQIGMFAFTGLNKDQVSRMTNEFHIYLTQDGRISLAGLNTKNVGYVAEAIHKVTSH